MNDFTKQELEMLYHCCRVYVTFSVAKDEKSIRLADKLLSMIDNYCEHSYGICYEGEQAKPICLKCRRAVY